MCRIGVEGRSLPRLQICSASTPIARPVVTERHGLSDCTSPSTSPLVDCSLTLWPPQVHAYRQVASTNSVQPMRERRYLQQVYRGHASVLPLTDFESDSDPHRQLDKPGACELRPRIIHSAHMHIQEHCATSNLSCSIASLPPHNENSLRLSGARASTG